MSLFSYDEFPSNDVLLEDLDSFEKRRRSEDESINFPPEILLLIFSYLDARELFHVQQVCKMYHEVSCDESLWKVLCHHKWPLSKEIPFQSQILKSLGWRFRYMLASGNRIIEIPEYALDIEKKTMVQLIHTDEGMEYATWAIKSPAVRNESLLMFIQYLKDTGFKPVKILYFAGGYQIIDISDFCA